ncbi:MAG TPA: acyl-CoA dehydrogenase family protein, partial [Sphingomonas sp.]|nr:acyl-CoA dehydrogenase family protein [Sphingomonas sp.]
MNLEPDPRDEAFREEVRAFIRENLPPDMATRGRRDFHPNRDDLVFWTRKLDEKGWVAPHWPVEYGGPDWRPMQRFIFEEEMRAGFAPTLDRIAIELVGPVLYTFGSAEQKAKYLPEVFRAERLWCQGFSEPGAGSDLASLRTRAVRDGDHYIVNGQKTWTTEAHNADMMLALVRTDPDAKPQRGISALLIDMRSPGLTRRPIYTIDEGLSVNEVFFDDVRVPAENLVGQENAGWSYAKFLLGNERTNSAEVPHTKRDIAQIEAIARIERKQGRPLIEDPVFASRLARLKIDALALEYAVYRVLADEGEGANSVASVLKVRGSELRQRAADLAVEALGDRGLAVAADP